MEGRKWRVVIWERKESPVLYGEGSPDQRQMKERERTELRALQTLPQNHLWGKQDRLIITSSYKQQSQSLKFYKSMPCKMEPGRHRGAFVEEGRGWGADSMA